MCKVCVVEDFRILLARVGPHAFKYAPVTDDDHYAEGARCLLVVKN